MKIIAWFAAVLLSVLTARATDFDLDTHGTLSITVPDSWTAKGKPVSDKNGASAAYSVELAPTNNANARGLLMVVFGARGMMDKEAIQKLVLRVGEQWVNGSVEKKVTLREFSVKQGYGAYCVFTDASLVGKPPKPGEYKVMGSGALRIGNHLLTSVTLYADDANGAEFKALLNMVNGMVVKPKASP
jgi:hypothetical protein